MRKKLLHLSIALCFSLMANAHAELLPTINATQLKLPNTKIIESNSIHKIAFARYVQGNELDLSFGNLEDNDLPEIIAFLRNHPEIKSLNLEGNSKLTGGALVPLASVETLTELNLARRYKDCPNGVCIGGFEAKDITAFVNNTHIVSLNLHMHSIGDEGAILLAKNTTLKYLNVGSNNITDSGAIALAHNNILERLAINANYDMTPKSAQAFADNQTLVELNLGQTGVRDEGAMALSANTHLKRLLVYRSGGIHDEGAMAFAKNTTLKELDISDNLFTAATAIAYGENHTLENLDISGPWLEKNKNPIGDEGVTALVKNQSFKKLGLFRQNVTRIGLTELLKLPHLMSLDLGINFIADDGVALLATHPEQWTELNLVLCNVTDKGAAMIANMPNLRLLDLLQNHIKDAGAAALSKNTSLKVLNLFANDIHDEGGVALAGNKTLDMLDVAFNRMGIVGLSALDNNRYIKTIYAGGTNPEPEVNLSLNNFNHNLRPNHFTNLSKDFCYRTTDMIQCVDRR